MTDTVSTPAPPRMAAPASAVAAVTGQAFDEAVHLTKRLKMPHLRRALEEVIPTAKAQRWDPAEIVRVLLAEEVAGRDASNLRTRRRRAAFPTGKSFHVWDETASSIPIPTQQALRTLEWVGRRENFCICGPSGTGKSHLCEALGQSAVDAGLAVSWFTIEDLGAIVRKHRVDDTVAKAFNRITRADLIIVDDIGLLPVSEDAAEGFYRLVDAAYEKLSLESEPLRPIEKEPLVSVFLNHKIDNPRGSLASYLRPMASHDPHLRLSVRLHRCRVGSDRPAPAGPGRLERTRRA